LKKLSEEIEKEISKRQKHLDNLNIAITQLNKTLHEGRQEKKALKEGKDEEVLTDAQILGLLKEHKDDDDPGTLLNIIKYISNQAVKGVKEEAIDGAEISRMKKEIDTGMHEAYPDLLEEGSELRVNVNEVKKNLGLNDSPFGDFLALSAMVHRDLDEIKTAEFERGKKEGGGEKPKPKVKKVVSLTPKGKGSEKETKTTLTAAQAKTAKGMGLTTPAQQKIYAAMLNKKSAKTVEV